MSYARFIFEFDLLCQGCDKKTTRTYFSSLPLVSSCYKKSLSRMKVMSRQKWSNKKHLGRMEEYYERERERKKENDWESDKEKR